MLWALLLLVVAPLAELWVILRVAQAIGGWETLALVLLGGAVGLWLVKRQGRAAIRKIDASLRANELPASPLADGFLILVAGLLILLPGFLSDAVGFLLLLPPTRALARAALMARLSARVGRGLTIVRVRGWSGPGGPVVDTTADEGAPPGTHGLPPGEDPR